MQSGRTVVAGEDSYRLIFRRYGLDAGTFIRQKDCLPPDEVGLMVEVIAPMQKLADGIL